MNLSKYFTYDECKCKGDKCCGNVAPMDRQFLAIADKLRELSGGPLFVNSGFRCRTHNTSIKGAEKSRHMEGIALDLYSKVKTPSEIGDIAKALGLFVIVYDNFVHIDGRYLK